MKLILVLSSLLLTNLVFGQINYSSEDSGTFQTGNIDSPFLRVSTSTGNKIEGSIYLDENWNQAIITDSQSNKTTSMAKFNAYHSEIEILKDDQVSSLIPVDGLKVFLNNRQFTPISIQDKPKTIFAEILVDGKNELYKVYDIKINKAPSDAKLLSIESTDKVVITTTLYYNKENEIIKYPASKRDIKENLSAETINVAKNKNLSLKKEEDIIKLFEYLNSL
ncbi:hypothetical protein [Maribacter sp.]|uniref:hypothetical protein n=1 Tax=Maribacter sp. TaxID=1897614 RepID=UPI0025BDD9F9|nr:hypothetical protein [Maribacter sp.]